MSLQLLKASTSDALSLNGISKRAFDHPGIIAIEAETDPDNVASQKVLKKCGFEPNGKIGEEGPRFTVYNKKSI